MSELAAPRFLDERVAHWAAIKPDEESITYFERTWTWSEWNERIRRLAGALKKFGVKRGDVVAFLDKNHPACVEVTTAAASLGAATAIINFRLAAEELGVSQGAVAQHVRGLEDSLGVMLFDRLPRTLALTEPGRRYASTIRRAWPPLSSSTRRMPRPPPPATALTKTG